MSTSAELRRIVDAMTDLPWKAIHRGHMQHDIAGPDPEWPELGAMWNAVNATGIEALANHADALVKLAEACQEMKELMPQSIYRALGAVHAVAASRTATTKG